METLGQKRVLIKISGETLAGEKGYGLDFDMLHRVVNAIKACADMGVQIAIVVGAGNIWRGVRSGQGKLERTRSDRMGMLGTTINALGLADVLEQHGLEVRVQTAVEMRTFAEPYVREEAVRHLEQGRVVIFGCGTGNPFFSTDTTSTLRALEIGADVALLAKNVDGVYDKDPRKFADAKKYDSMTYDEVLEKHLGVIDMTAASMAGENDLPILLFDGNDPQNIVRALSGEKIGTLLKNTL